MESKSIDIRVGAVTCSFVITAFRDLSKLQPPIPFRIVTQSIRYRNGRLIISPDSGGGDLNRTGKGSIANDQTAIDPESVVGLAVDGLIYEKSATVSGGEGKLLCVVDSTVWRLLSNENRLAHVFHDCLYVEVVGSGKPSCELAERLRRINNL